MFRVLIICTLFITPAFAKMTEYIPEEASDSLLNELELIYANQFFDSFAACSKGDKPACNVEENAVKKLQELNMCYDLVKKYWYHCAGRIK